MSTFSIVTENTKVVEQPSTDCGSILCNIESDVSYGSNMYFVCDKNKRIIQYFSWMSSDQRLHQFLKKLGYTLWYEKLV